MSELVSYTSIWYTDWTLSWLCLQKNFRLQEFKVFEVSYLYWAFWVYCYSSFFSSVQYTIFRHIIFSYIYILCIIIIIIMILCPSCTGSNKVFAALLDRCLARKVAPIVRMVARRGSSVSWAALIPQKEELDEKNCQISPPGFYACHLPFAGVFFFFSVIVNGSCRKNNNIF